MTFICCAEYQVVNIKAAELNCILFTDHFNPITAKKNNFSI